MTSRLNALFINDFTGGLVTNWPSNSLQNNQSMDLDNIHLMNRGFFKRLGDLTFNNTAMNSGANVQGLAYYRPVSGTKYLLSICGNKIYKSDALDGTMDDITGAVSITASQNNIWTYAALKDLAIFVGGAPDAPIKWSGSGNAAALGGSPVSGKFCFQMRDRLFIGGPTANPSTIYWPVISNPEDWSGTGSGNNACVTNDGDILVGGIPLNNNVALLFKRYSIHLLVVESAPFPIKPLNQGLGLCGKNAVVNVAGNVYFISNEPRMYSTDGYSIQPYPDNINNIWDGINKSRLEYIQGIYYPVENQIHWLVSNGSSSTNNLCLIWDLERKCWLRNTVGFNSNVACVADGYRLFGGHYDGKIYEKNVNTRYIDDSEAYKSFNSYWKTGWITFDSDFTVKQPRYAELNFSTQTLGSIDFSYGFDYSANQNLITVDQEQTGGKWDVDTWDGTFIWGGRDEMRYREFMFGRGNNFQMMIGNCREDEAMKINSLTLAFKQQGTKELTTI